MDHKDQRAFSAAIAVAHDEWRERYRDVPPKHPERLGSDGDYAEHYLDLEATPEMESEYQRLVTAQGWRRVSREGSPQWVRVERGQQ